MNIQKTNKLGLHLINRVISKHDIQFMLDKNKLISENGGLLRDNEILFNAGIFSTKQKDEKVLRLSFSVVNNAMLIDINSIKDNLDSVNIDFNYLTVLLPNDEWGVIRFCRVGADISFFYVSHLNLLDTNPQVEINNYSFISKNFQLTESAKSIFAVQILTYLIYGDITNRFIPANGAIKQGYSRFLNNSKTNITFVDSLWKQRISTEGFKVSGHFRLQPIGEKRLKRKLIWIEEFDKHGYNRKATVEM